MAAALRDRVEAKLGRPLPFDNDVLDYLAKVAPLAKSADDIVSDFCPKWSVEDRGALAACLLNPPSDGGFGQQQSTHDNWGSKESPSVRDIVADEMLARMLQEDPDADLGLVPGHGSSRGSKKKKGFRPLAINYAVGQHATPASLGTAQPSSLADLLRSRRQGQQRIGNMAPEAFGPPAARQGASAWAPVPQDSQGMTWAERTQISTERAANETAHAVAAVTAPTTVSSAVPAAMSGSICLRLMTSTGAEYQVHADPGETFGDVKAHMEKTHGIPASRQRFLHLGRELADAQAIRNAGLITGQTLQLALRNPQPGSKADPPLSTANIGTRAAEEMTLRFRLPGGNSEERLHRLATDLTVPMLKHRIQKEFGIRADCVSLTFYGRELTDELCISDYGVASGGLIDVALCPPKPSVGAPTPFEASEQIRAAPTPQGFEVSLGQGSQKRKNKKGPESGSNALEGLQTSEHGRILTESEALEMALAASRTDSSDPLVPERAGRQEEMGCDESGEQSGDEDPEEARRLEAAEFHVDVSPQDAKLQALLTHARRVSSMTYSRDLISRASKRSGYRVTLLVEKGKKVKTVLGYVVYRFTKQNVLNILQIGATEQQRSVLRYIAQWLLQHARKAGVELVAMSCPPNTARIYKKFGFVQVDGKSMECSDCEDGDLYLECRCKKSNSGGGTTAKPGRANHVPGSASEGTSRIELVRRLFALFDADNDGFLNVKEMYGFALQTGFDGPEAEWPAEFRALCADSGANASVGVDEATLRRLVDDPSDAGCHCTNEELQKMVRDLASVTPPSEAPPELTLPKSNLTLLQNGVDAKRPQLVQEVFHLCDQDADGRLKKQEMLRFAELTGFEGNEQEWDEEYRLLCADHGLDTNFGIAKDTFVRLVDDESDAGQYCSDDELREMLEKLRSECRIECVEDNAAGSGPNCKVAATPPGFCLDTEEGEGADDNIKKRVAEDSEAKDEGIDNEVRGRGSGVANEVTNRKELVHKLFILLDADGNGFLNAQEMYGFAVRTGFDGPEAEWPAEFVALCTDSGANASVGVSEETLQRLVDDSSDAGCHCTDEELHEMVQNLTPATPSLAAPPGLTLLQSDPAPAPLPTVPPPSAADDPRRRLVDEVFHVCDRDADGRLKRHEMLEFAKMTGFDGKEPEWDEEYRLLCADHGLDPQLGIGKDEFARLVDDESDAGQYCTYDELREMLEKLCLEPVLQDPKPVHEGTASVASTAPTLAPTPVSVGLQRPSQQVELPTTTPASWQQPEPPSVEPELKQKENNSAGLGPDCAVASVPPGFSRDDLINAVFRALDEDQDGHLNKQEIKVFAGRIGFEGSDEEWSGEFGAICPDARGVSPELFQQLANDTSDEGCYCTTEELRTILRDLFPKVRARQGTTAEAAEAAATTEAARAEAPRASPVALQRLQTAEAAAPHRSRSELVRLIFEVCDSDGNQRLNLQEMRRFADAIGFEGEDQEWEVEFAALFDGRSDRPNTGVSLQFFSELVDDVSENGCYCTDEELCAMYDKFSK